MHTKIKDFWIKYEYKLVLAVALLLIAAISFEFGYIRGKAVKAGPVVIETPSGSPQIGSGSPVSATMGSNTATGQKAPIDATSQIPKDCLFVGSKNSTKYHTPTCHFAKLIKVENLVCFKSAEEAIAQGRVGDKGCVK